MQVVLPPSRAGEETQWVEVKEIDELRDGDRKAILKGIKLPAEDGAEVSAGIPDQMYDGLLAQIVTNWSFQLPLPSQYPASLDALTLTQARELRKAVEPHYDVVFGKDDPTRPNTDPTEGSAS